MLEPGSLAAQLFPYATTVIQCSNGAEFLDRQRDGTVPVHFQSPVQLFYIWAPFSFAPTLIFAHALMRYIMGGQMFI